MAAFFGQMSFDQTGVQACLAPWVTRPLPAKKSTKVGREVLRSSFEQFLCLVSILETVKDLGMAKMLRCRVRYFTDGAVIGSKEFVNEAFARSRERFGPKRQTGARRLKGDSEPASGVLWSLRDLRKGIA